MDGHHYTAYYSDVVFVDAFPHILKSGAVLLVNLLSRIFTYDPGKRATAEELVSHPWFSYLPVSMKQ